MLALLTLLLTATPAAEPPWKITFVPIAAVPGTGLLATPHRCGDLVTEERCAHLIAFTKTGTPNDVALEVDIPNGEVVDAPFSLHILVQDPRSHRCPSAERQDDFCIAVESSEPSVAGLVWTLRGQVGKVRHGKTTYAAEAFRLGPEGMTKPKATTAWELIGRPPS